MNWLVRPDNARQLLFNMQEHVKIYMSRLAHFHHMEADEVPPRQEPILAQLLHLLFIVLSPRVESVAYALHNLGLDLFPGCGISSEKIQLAAPETRGDIFKKLNMSFFRKWTCFMAPNQYITPQSVTTSYLP